MSAGVLAPSAAFAEDTADFSIQKEVSDAGPHGPGDAFSYELLITCRSGTADPCYNTLLTDVLPAPLEFVGSEPVRVTMVPVGEYELDIDEDNSSFTLAPINSGATDGAWSSGGNISVIVDVRVPFDTEGTWNGATLTNTASIDADNTPVAEDSVDVTLAVETTLVPSIEKTVSTGTVPAVPGRAVDWTITPGNASNQNVDQIVVQDPVTVPAAFAPYLEIAGIDITDPEGTVSRTVEYYVGDEWTATEPDPLSQAQGVRVTFDGDFPPGETGEVVIHTVTTEAVEDIETGETVPVSNDAQSTVGKGDDTSEPVDDSASVNIAATDPDVSITKVFADSTLTSGQSTVADIVATNGAQDVQTLTITEPSADHPGFTAQGLTFDGFGDVVHWPIAATSAEITYTYADCASETLTTSDVDTLPSHDPACTVEGFVVTFSAEGDDIRAGSYASLPLEVTALPLREEGTISSTNHVDTEIENSNGQTGTDEAEAPFTIDPLVVDTQVSKSITPSTVWGVPGADATVTITGGVSEDSTVGSDFLIISDPVDPEEDPGAEFWDAFTPTAIGDTDVPECVSLTLYYWSETEGDWLPLPGGQVEGPVAGYTYDIPSGITDIGGIRYEFEPTCIDELPPGFNVITRVDVEVSETHDEDATYTNDVQSWVDNENSINRNPTAEDDADIEVLPIDGEGPGPDFVDKNWIEDDVTALSGDEATARLRWSTQGLNITHMTITDPASAGELTTLADSVYDAFDLIRIPAITSAVDPLIVDDEITEVLLYLEGVGWTDVTAAACANGCVGQFGGFDLDAAGYADDTVGVRITYSERVAGAGVGSSYDRRPLDLTFQVRDTLRSDPSQWVLGELHDYTYNTSDPGLVENTVHAHGVGPGVDHDSSDADTILILDRPLIPEVTKEFDQEVLGLPEDGTDADDYPLITSTIVATNGSVADVSSMRIVDASPEQEEPTAYDVLDLHQIELLALPEGITRDDVTVTLTHEDDSETILGAEAAEEMTPAQLANVVNVAILFAVPGGFPEISQGAHADVALTWQLRDEKRSGGPVEITQPGGQPIVNETQAFIDSPGRIACVEGETVPGCSSGLADDDAEFHIVEASYEIAVSKTIAPAEAYEDRAGESPQNRRYETTLTGQPLGTARAIDFVLTDVTATFWNTMDYVSTRITVPRPVNQLAFDVLLEGDVDFDHDEAANSLATLCGTDPIGADSSCWTLGDWIEVTPGSTVALLPLPDAVAAAEVVGVRFRAQVVDEDGNPVQWERPFNPLLSFVVTTDRRDTLRTDPAVEVSTTRLDANPGENEPGVISNDVTGDSVGRFGPEQEFPRSETDEDDTIVRHWPNSIEVTKDRGPQFADITRPVPYVITVRNTGQWHMTDFTIVDEIDTDVEGPLLVEPTPPNYVYTLSGPGVTDPNPDFTADFDTDTGVLTFTPPDGFVFMAGWTLTISTPLMLREGLSPNDVVENSVTVSADRAFETCTYTTTNMQFADPLSDVDDCTASTSVSPLSSATLAMRKFVKGDQAGDPAIPADDDLGVRDVTDGTPLTCDPTQPGVTDMGYFSYPCAPITRPGGNADWRIDLTNTGNTPARVVAGIDTLPRVGDHPVVAPGNRESQFGVTLTGEVATNLDALADSSFAESTLLISPHALSQSCNENAIRVYTHNATPTPGCDYEWIASADATQAQIDAARTILFVIEYGTGDETTPTPGLRPQETLRINFGTLTPWALPAESAVSDGVPVAYNSFAAATRSVATTQPERPSLVSEPQKVGIATATGQLELTKNVSAPDYQADIELPTQYEFLVTCVSGEEEVTLLRADGSDASRPIVPGDGQVFVYNHETGPVNLPLFADCDIVEDPVPTGATVEITPDGAVVAERDLSVLPSVWDPYEGDTSLAAFEILNTFTAGGFVVEKRIDNSGAVNQDGDPILYNEEFSFEASCLYLDQEAIVEDQQSFTLFDGEQVEFAGIPTGAECTITEVDSGSATSTNVTVRIGDAEPVVTADDTAEFTIAEGEIPQLAVGFENVYSVGALDVTKEITGNGAVSWGTGPFEIHVICTLPIADPTTVYDHILQLTPDAPIQTIENLPLNAECAVTETDNAGATETWLDPVDGVVIIDDGQSAAAVIVTNDFRTGAFQILKEVEGPGAPTFSDGPFEFAAVCTYQGGGVYEGTLILEGDGTGDPIHSEVVGDLPVGADCTITEVDSGGADATPPPVSITILDEETEGVETVVTAAFLNAFSVGTATIEKIVDGEAAEESWATDVTFTILATCQIEIDGTLATLHSASYMIAGGEVLPLADPLGDPLLLPGGAHCFIEETVTGGATAASVSHDGYDNALVVEEGDEVQVLELVATNTFEYAGFDVTKTVTGTGAAEGRAKTFEIVAVCVLDQGGEEPLTVLDESFPITHSETVTFRDLPVGTDCTVTESDAAGAVETKMTVSGGDAVTEAEFTLLEDESVSVEIENVFEAPMPATGFDASRLWVIGGIAAAVLVLGGILLLVARKRRRDGSDLSQD